MDGNVSRLKSSDMLNSLKGVLASKYFPFFTGAVTLLCYYLGLDLLTIYFLAAAGILMILLLDDLTPLVSPLTFLHIIISMKNTPTHAMENSSDFFMRPAVLAQIIAVVAVYIAAMLWRVFAMAKRKSYKPSPVLFGLCVFAAALLLNGAFDPQYTFNNLLYGAILAFFFLGIFVLLSGNIKICPKNYERLGWGFLAFSAVLVIEMAVKVITNFGSLFDESGRLIKEVFIFGWGIWNTMGMLLVISIPAVAMLANKYKHGYLLIFYITVLALSAVISTSRQAMLGVALFYPASVIAVIVKAKRKSPAIICVALVAAAGIAVLILKWNALSGVLEKAFTTLFDDGGTFTGNGRLSLWRRAIKYFTQAPLFGKGFHVDFPEDSAFVGLGDFIPLMAHNTLVELLAAGGIVLFLAYALHRIQTVIAFFKHPTADRYFIGISVLALLFMSLLDNHLFYIFPTIIYSALLPFAVGQSSEGRALLPARGGAAAEKSA